MMWTELLPTSMAAMRMRYVDVTRRTGRSSAHATTPLPGLLARALRRGGRALAGAVADARRGDPDGVHDTRVACRRLRETLDVVGAAGDTGRLDRRLRRLARAMGPVRELDVARTVLDDRAIAENWAPGVVARIEASCAERRDRAHLAMLHKVDRLDPDALLRALDAVRGAVAAGANGSGWTRSLARRVRTRATEFVQAIDRAGTLYEPDALHEIRLAAKKLRYLLELPPSDAPWRPGRARGRLRRAQSALGSLGDLRLLQREVQRLAARAGGARRKRQALTAIDQALEARCRAAHAEVLRSLPGLRALGERLAHVNALDSVHPRAARMAPARTGRVEIVDGRP
jgi:CHAD domain-containing protein